MVKRLIAILAALCILLPAASCGRKTPAPEPAAFTASPCVLLSVQFKSESHVNYRLQLKTDKGSWGLRVLDYPGMLLPPGTMIQEGESGREDLPFDRFLDIFRSCGAEAWDGWETKGGEDSFSLELQFADGSGYSASGGEAPEGFTAFREAMALEMARFAEDWCGIPPQTVQERLLNVCPMFGDEGGRAYNDGGISYDIYSAYHALIPLGDKLALYHSPGSGSKASAKAGVKALAPFLGEKLTDTEVGEWYRVRGCNGKKYLISREAEGVLRLWVFRYFVADQTQRRENTTGAELLHEIYAVESPEDILAVNVEPAPFGLIHLIEPEDRLKPWVLEDREAIGSIYAMLFGLDPVGDWRSEDAMERRAELDRHYVYSFTSGNDGDDYFGTRVLQLVLADGTTIDKLYYKANLGYLYDMTYAGHDGFLTDGEVETMNAILGIA